MPRGAEGGGLSPVRGLKAEAVGTEEAGAESAAAEPKGTTHTEREDIR